MRELGHGHLVEWTVNVCFDVSIQQPCVQQFVTVQGFRQGSHPRLQSLLTHSLISLNPWNVHWKQSTPLGVTPDNSPPKASYCSIFIPTPPVFFPLLAASLHIFRCTVRTSQFLFSHYSLPLSSVDHWSLVLLFILPSFACCPCLARWLKAASYEYIYIYCIYVLYTHRAFVAVVSRLFTCDERRKVFTHEL